MSKSSRGLGCLILFALPFAAGGVFVLLLAGRMLWSWIEVQTWHETPARILHTELIVHQDDSATYEVVARYEYEVAGVTYLGERVWLGSGADNIGSFHQDRHRQLRALEGSGETIRCFVDPDEPSRAILFREMRWGLFSLMAVFGLVFAAVGFGLIGVGIWGKRRVDEDEQLAAAHPAEPWRWKREWADGRVQASGKAQFVLPCTMAVLWNLASAPLIFVVPEEVIEKENHLALLGLVFPLVGVGLAIWAIRSFLRWRKFGDSVFEMSTFPGVIGGQLVGRVLTSVHLKPDKGFQLTLSCIHRETRGSGDNRNTREQVLWQQETHLERGLAAHDFARSEIPVRFHVPFDASPTEERSKDDEILWRLEVEAEVPGVDYASRFEVPVFRTADSRPDPEPSEAATEDEWRPVISSEELASSGILSELLPTGGYRLTFAAARHKGPAALLTLFLILWLGFNYLLIHLDAPLLLTGVWSLFSLLVFIGTLDLWFERRIVETHPDKLVLSGGILGMGRTREIQRSSISEIRPVRGMQSGNKLYYRIQVSTQDGKKHIAATKIENLSLARQVIEHLS